MKKFFGNEVVEVGSLYNIHTNMYESNVSVEIVDEDDISILDKYIGQAEYLDYTDCLIKVFDNGEKLIGYLEENEE